MGPKINFDFKKTKISVTAAEFLMEIYNPTEEEDSTELKDNLKEALGGNSLKVKDANFLLQQILIALTIDDNELDEIINYLFNEESRCNG